MTAKAEQKSKVRSAAESMIEKFQCSGCIHGSDIECGTYKPSSVYGHRCEAHVLGTMFGLGGLVALGLPTGFNKPGPDDKRERNRTLMIIRLWPDGTEIEWNHLNVPVWFLETDGDLYVKTFMPRVNDTAVDVIAGGRDTLSDTQVDALDEMGIDVQAFYSEID